VLLAAALVVLGLVADRGLLGGTLHGGRLLPAPQGASDLWSLYGAAWHPVGLGSTTATPPWVAVMALLSSVLFGKVWLAVDVVVLGAVPLAGLSAYAAVGRITRAWPVRVWVAVAYAFTPVLTGAVAGGRLDVVAITVLLPLVVRACAAAVAVDQQARGWHRSAGAGLLLAVAASFLPLLWVLVAGAVVVGVLVEALAARVPWPVTARRMLAGAGVLGVAAAALVPWTGTVLVHPRLLVSGLGLPETFARRHPQQVADLLLLHPGGAGQPPLWVAAPVVLAALVGLGRAHHRAAARAGFVLVAVGLTAALVESRLSGVTAGIPASRYWTGGALAFAVVGALVAAAVAADGARTALARHAFGWRQPAAVLVAAAAVAGSVAAAVSWVGRAAEGPLTDRSSQLLPLFAAAEVTLPTSPRVLALRADGDLVRYALVRKASGPELGDADVVTLSTSGPARVARRRLADAVRDLAAARPQAVNGLAPFAVAMVATPATVAALAQLPDVDGLSHVPAPGAVIYRTGDAPGELVVRRPGSATGAAVAAAPGAARTTVPAGPTGRLLVLAEPRDRHWRARLDGRSLPATTADGWAQAWCLPAAGGRLVVDRTGDSRPTWLTVEAVVVVLALLLSIPNRRRRRPGTSGEAGP
jgi:hypothetical protein